MCYILKYTLPTLILWWIHISYSVLVSASSPNELYQLKSDNIFRITLVVADWIA